MKLDSDRVEFHPNCTQTVLKLYSDRVEFHPNSTLPQSSFTQTRLYLSTVLQNSTRATVRPMIDATARPMIDAMIVHMVVTNCTSWEAPVSTFAGPCFVRSIRMHRWPRPEAIAYKSASSPRPGNRNPSWGSCTGLGGTSVAAGDT